VYALLLARDADEKAVLTLVLKRAGLAVTTANDVDHALRTWPERPADLIVLAIKDQDALSGVRAIRAETSVPILAIVDPVDEETHCELLESGADLVVARPFGARLLIARVRVLLRRAGGVPRASLPTLSIAGLTLDPTTRTVQVADHASRRLTHLEFRLLYTLMTHRGQVIPIESIVEQVWGYGGRGDKELVRGLIRRLRTKVEPDPHNPRYILTTPGVGYSFTEDEE
jgi:DNA-binding response OmpR family regulator